MALISLRCPSCGADIELDETREFGFCSYCGTKVMMDKQIVELKGKVNVDGISTVDKLLERAFILIEDREYFEADGYLNKVLELEPKCAKSYWGKMLCEFRIPYAKTAEIKGIDITQSNNYKRAVSYATGKQKEKYVEYGEKAAGIYGENEQKALDEQKKNKIIFLISKIAFVIIPIITFFMVMPAREGAAKIAFSVFTIALSILWIVSYFANKKLSDSEKKGKGNAWRFVGGLLLAMAIFISFSQRVPVDESSSSDTTTSTIVTTTEPTTEAPIEITAIKLIKEYQNNEIAFEKKFVGKTLLISGVIDDISSSYGSNYISISDGDSWVNVDCYLLYSEEEKAAEYNTGDYITIRGKCKGESWGDPQLSSCEIIE